MYVASTAERRIGGAHHGGSRRPDGAQIAKSVAELVCPAVIAMLPFGLVFGGSATEAVVDATFVLVTVFSAILMAANAPLPVSLVFLMCFGAAASAWTARPNIFAITVIPLVAFVMRHADIRTLIRRFTWVSAALFGLVVTAYRAVGFNSGSDLVMWRAYSGEFVSRSSLGFYHPNRAMMEWSVIAVAILAFASPRKRLRWFVPVLIITAAAYMATDSRTSGWLTFAILALAILWRRKLDRPVGPGVRQLALLAPLVFTLASFGLARLATDPNVNALLSGRPVIYARLLDQYSLFSLFGHPIIEQSMVDNGYLQMFLSKGPILAIIYFVILVSLVAKPARLSWRSVSILALFLVWSVFETTLLEFPQLFILLASLEIDRRAAQESESDVMECNS